MSMKFGKSRGDPRFRKSNFLPKIFLGAINMMPTSSPTSEKKVEFFVIFSIIRKEVCSDGDRVSVRMSTVN